jgi:hypothetical protein
MWNPHSAGHRGPSCRHHIFGTAFSRRFNERTLSSKVDSLKLNKIVFKNLIDQPQHNACLAVQANLVGIAGVAEALKAICLKLCASKESTGGPNAPHKELVIGCISDAIKSVTFARKAESNDRCASWIFQYGPTALINCAHNFNTVASTGSRCECNVLCFQVCCETVDTTLHLPNHLSWPLCRVINTQ